MIMDAPIPVPILTKSTRWASGVDAPLLAETEQVGVIVDHCRYRVVAGQVITDRIVVPARHADRARNPPGVPVHRPRYAHPNAAQRLRRPAGSLQHGIQFCGDRVKNRAGPLLDRTLDHGLVDHLTSRRTDGEPTMSGAQIGDQDRSGLIVDAQPGGQAGRASGQPRCRPR